MNSHNALYQAVLTRDGRFDGTVFVAVKTTGIYCRPICPARPKREHVEFFKTAEAAEQAGYRPCLRCRPESAPGSPAWSGKRATVQRALTLITQGVLHDHTEEILADRLGITARHLRRLFEREFGQTPKQLHDHTRLNFARQLIVETQLPMMEIAYSAGFRSLRRFNDAVKRRFHRPPSTLRSLRNDAKSSSMICLSLPYRPPFDWGRVLEYFRRHQVIGLEAIERDVYSRVFRLEETNTTGFFSARLHATKPEMLLEMTISDTRQLLHVVQRIRHMFDMDSDPLLIAKPFGQSTFLKMLQRTHRGSRLARGFDPFETAVGTILGQVISVEHTSRLMSQLVATYGGEISHPLTGDRIRLFPTPRQLAETDLHALKITRQKRATIREFASRVVQGTIRLEGIQDMEEFKTTVRTVKGIGAWSAEYMALRALGDTDAFPATDLVLQRFMNANPNIDPDVVRPWRSYLAVYLWHQFGHGSQPERKYEHARLHSHGISGRSTHTGGRGIESHCRALAKR